MLEGVRRALRALGVALFVVSDQGAFYFCPGRTGHLPPGFAEPSALRALGERHGGARGADEFVVVLFDERGEVRLTAAYSAFETGVVPALRTMLSEAVRRLTDALPEASREAAAREAATFSERDAAVLALVIAFTLSSGAGALPERGSGLSGAPRRLPSGRHVACERAGALTRWRANAARRARRSSRPPLPHRAS